MDLVIYDNWFEENWEHLHERNLEQYRRNEIKQKASMWGSHMKSPHSSYRPELSALIKGLMILPASWDVEWVTDSESSIKTLESQGNNNSTDRNKFQLEHLYV